MKTSKLTLSGALLISLLIISCDEDPLTREYYSDEGFTLSISGEKGGESFNETLSFPLYESLGSSIYEKTGNGYQSNTIRKTTDYLNSISFVIKMDHDYNFVSARSNIFYRTITDSINYIRIDQYYDFTKKIVSDFQFKPESGEMTFVFNDSTSSYIYNGTANLKVYKLIE